MNRSRLFCSFPMTCEYGSWRASIRFCARIGTMNRCASQRRGPDRGSATRSLLGSWRKVLILFLILAMASNPALAAERKPNNLVVLADQWRAQAFGFAGDPNVRTPNLDRLASESVRFINAVAGMPVCSPTRASLLTGRSEERRVGKECRYRWAP